MNCDRIAPFYEWIEKAAFGGKLQGHRLTFLRAAEGKQRVLVLGDGDGRFTQALAMTYPELAIDSVELSTGMVREARKRLTQNSYVRVIQGDVLNFDFRAARYDVVYTHFFLDCFNTKTARSLIGRLSTALPAEACWVISDFRVTNQGWRKLYTKAWLAAMYAFFRYATGLKTKRLPEYESAMEAAGFRKCQERVSTSGLIASEWWQR